MRYFGGVTDRRGIRPPGGPRLDDTLSRITLFEAIGEDLGLKQARKRLMPVLVIDRIERQPAEN